ncbi:EFR3 family protein [Pleurotus pulmonarius]
MPWMMNLLFTPNHVQLLNACYPPSSMLLSSGPDFTPKGQELSRLTYYASNHPSKLNKLGSELEKRLKGECRKAQQGNTRTRVSLLISLSIFRSLAIECRRDIHLISPSLISSINTTLGALPNDLEVTARAASVFTAWTTYTDGQQIGADSQLTRDYISTLQRFADLSSSTSKDHENRNRQKLIGLAALTGALSSEALYNDMLQFRAQVAVIMRPILYAIFGTPLQSLDHHAMSVKELPMSPYLAEFRRRPAIERRAASIHVHVDGEKGPSDSDVSIASLHAVFSLLSHANGLQMAYIMRSSLDSLDGLKAWDEVDHCRWFVTKAVEWAQYQYRYAVASCIVERLIEMQDGVAVSSYSTLATMLTTVFNSPFPLINLSTSDINSNLVTLLLRRINVTPNDSLLPDLVRCIASLGSHIYYTDQVHDLAGEIINRISLVESRAPNVVPGQSAVDSSRSQSIRCLLSALLGIIHSATEHEASQDSEKRRTHGSIISDGHSQEPYSNERSLRRTRVPCDIWQDTLSLLCDQDFAVRADYAEALALYLSQEMPRLGETTDRDGVLRPRRLETGPLKQAVNMQALFSSSDIGTKFLNAVHAFVYMLATDGSSPTNGNSTPRKGENSSNPSSGRRSTSSAHAPRARKYSIVQRFLSNVPSRISLSSGASMSDYAHALKILTIIHQQHPARGLLIGVPMLLALDEATRVHDLSNDDVRMRVQIVRGLIARVLVTIGTVWSCSELVDIAQQALSSLPPALELPIIPSSDLPEYHPPLVPMPFPSLDKSDTVFPGVNLEAALLAIASNEKAQESTGLDEQSMVRVLTARWTAESAIKSSIDESSGFESVRGDVVSPLIRISPALMNIENVSLHSLARSTRGVGVADLREALEGRSMSNPALARPASISTLDHTSLILAPQARSRSRTKKRGIPSGSGDVRDVLNRLGIGKQNGSLLKASFPNHPPLRQ